jgi:hypothetical protein
MAAVISLFSIITLVRGGDAWLGLLYFLILLIPLSSTVYLRFRTKKNATGKVDSFEKWSRILLSLQGGVLACWVFDLATTFYALDVAKIATEINPLGWPLGAVGALIYYGPTLVLTCVLLFKQKQKVSLYTAAVVTALSLYMGAMNLNAGIGNFSFFVTTASLSGAIRYSLLALVVAADLFCIAAFARLSAKQSLSGRGKLRPTGSSLP